MRILYCITGLELGGAEMQLLLLSQEMVRRNHQVLVLVMKSGGALMKKFSESGIQVVDLNISSFQSILKSISTYRKVVKGFNPDVVHSHMIHANIYSRLMRLFVPMNRLVCTAHNISEGNKLMMSLYGLTDKLANFTTNVSQEALDHYINIKAISPKKAVFIPNAIDTDKFKFNIDIRNDYRKQFGFDEDTFIFLAVGRLHPQKDYFNLLNALLLLKKSSISVPFKLLIAGVGEIEDLLIEFVKVHNLYDQVIFLGRRDDISGLMCMADCFVLSSKYEGFGLVVAEALASELSVIATDAGGVKEVLGGFGQLVPIENSELLSMAMSNEMSHQKSMNKIDGRTHIIKTYSKKTVLDQWINLFAI